MKLKIALFTIFLMLTMGCSSVPKKTANSSAFAADGTVTAEIVDKPTNERYEALPGESFVRELPKSENVRPTYPSSLLAKQLEPVSVIARIIVNGAGDVEAAEIVESSSPAPEFSESVLAAVKTWTFIPLMRVTGNRKEPLPFMQDYRFTFKQINGRAIVIQGSPPDS